MENIEKIENNMMRISHQNTCCFLRYAHERNVKRKMSLGRVHGRKLNNRQSFFL